MIEGGVLPQCTQSSQRLKCPAKACVITDLFRPIAIGQPPISIFNVKEYRSDDTSGGIKNES